MQITSFRINTEIWCCFKRKLNIQIYFENIIVIRVVFSWMHENYPLRMVSFILCDKKCWQITSCRQRLREKHVCWSGFGSWKRIAFGRQSAPEIGPQHSCTGWLATASEKIMKLPINERRTIAASFSWSVKTQNQAIKCTILFVTRDKQSHSKILVLEPPIPGNRIS